MTVVLGASVNAADISLMLSDVCGHVPLQLQALPNARVLWVNARAAAQDPNFQQLGVDLAEYSRHLLAQCSFGLQGEGALSVAGEQTQAKAIADRYGGRGIGSNGGAGRAAVLNGYYVKGVGPTPLGGKLADPVHSTGHCELEECIREAVLSECMGAEFPWGAVPVLAIIGTGLFKPKIVEAGIAANTNTDSELGRPDKDSLTELCLLVRPAFLRPAHFDRAANFLSDLPKQGFADAQRVKAMVQEALTTWGSAGFKQVLHQLHTRWATQLAYGYVHRFCHGAPSPSNVALDGRLLDFGATATLPTWARAHTVFGGPVAGQELPVMVQALHSMLQQIQHQCPELALTR